MLHPVPPALAEANSKERQAALKALRQAERQDLTLNGWDFVVLSDAPNAIVRWRNKYTIKGSCSRAQAIRYQKLVDGVLKPRKAKTTSQNKSLAAQLEKCLEDLILWRDDLTLDLWGEDLVQHIKNYFETMGASGVPQYHRRAYRILMSMEPTTCLEVIRAVIQRKYSK